MSVTSVYIDDNFQLWVEFSDGTKMLAGCVQHTTVYGESKEATCTENGYTPDIHCIMCNKVLVESEVIPAGHKPGAEATCTTDQTCTACGVTLTSALEHTPQFVPGYAATNKKPGLTDGVQCSVCQTWIVAQEVIPATGGSVEAMDFGGRTFTLVGCDGEADGFNSAKEIYSEESDAISVAVRERNALIESLYNCKIKGLSSPTPAGDAMNEVTTNQHNIDIYTHHYAVADTATNGKVYNLLDLGTTNIDFSQSWWDQEYVNTYTIKNSAGRDTLYSIVGDFALSTFDCTHAIVFNKTVFNNSNFNDLDLYQLVRDNEWTMDYFMFCIKAAAMDCNADGIIDATSGDIAGWIRTAHASHGLHAASGLSIMKNTDGVLSFEVDKNTNAWVDLIDKSIEIWTIPEGQTTSYSVVPELVAGGYTLFASEILGNSLGNLKDYDVEIGLLPYPLVDENQEDYAHFVDNHFYAYSIPVSVPDPDTVADFFNIYAYHSQDVREAYMSVYAYEYCSDQDSREMLDIILGTMTYDPGYLCASLEFDLSNMIQNNKNNVALFAAKKAATANDWIARFVAGIDDNPVWGNPENPKPEEPNPEEPKPEETTGSTATTATTVTAVTTTAPSVFARFDFGTDSKGEALGMTSHQYLVGALTYDSNFISVEYTDDSIIVTAVQDHPEMLFSTEEYNYGKEIFDGRYTVTSYALCYEDLLTYDFDDELKKENKYMRFRIKNNSTNNIMSFRWHKSGQAYSTTMSASGMYLQGGTPTVEDCNEGNHRLTCEASNEYCVYTYDINFIAAMCRFNSRQEAPGSSYGAMLEHVANGGSTGSNNWNWMGTDPCSALEFFVLGAHGGNATSIGFANFDTRANIVKGASVEIDYILFGSSAEALDGYTSYIEDAYNETK